VTPEPRSAGLGYTLATGRLYCDFAEFHAWAEKLAGRPIFTHEFADERVWAELREAFETEVFEARPPESTQGAATLGKDNA
jgi:hypothetical protein